jgi:hypothetical protein
VADRDGAKQCAPPLDVPSMEGLGRCSMTDMTLTLTLTLTSVALVTTSIALPAFVEERVRCPKRGNAPNSTD